MHRCYYALLPRTRSKIFYIHSLGEQTIISLHEGNYTQYLKAGQFGIMYFDWTKAVSDKGATQLNKMKHVLSLHKEFA